MADHRDHAMWTVWINTARRALSAAPPPAPVKTRQPRPTAAAPAEDLPAITIASAPPPRSRPHVVPPVTFLAASQSPTNSAEQ
jgi:hypothetical protein